MKRALEFAGFAVLAIAVHLAVLAMHRSSNIDMMSSGSDGQAEITLHAVTGNVNEIINQWMAPPEITAMVADMTPPETAALRDILRPVSPQVSRRMPAPVPILAPTSEARAPIIQTESYTPPKRPVAAKRKPQPKAKAKPSQTQNKKAAQPPARQAQRASGTGGGSQAGANGKTQSAGLSQGKQSKLIAKWGGQVRNRILRHKRFPSGASGTGTVRLRIIVAQSGKLVSVTVTRSSGSAAFDSAALRAVRSARSFPRAPKGLTQPQYTFTLNIRFG
ncbi:cell envelope integrity protein TolA [Lentibacter sp. XHP0401]|jgi:periplasmic protein TonB|uniref:cell envelope integrity protein TolA n=1 Tax=Lentibacter sp. XHP0401 TaxID=2984334 RepID=UPI0021E73C6C|nr:cell envelope integrity protein TolA [Lentibacter sp. XHP0401]MCV2892761.1 cell envelope integrity protein TolA [Lentibacter sp. XHP0401]